MNKISGNKLRHKIFLLIAIIFTTNSYAQVGSVSVKTWADDKKAAFSLTFDDGFISHYQTARPILNSYGFKGTFYLISGSMTETLPGIWRYGSWQQFREMAAEGHEIGSHTVKHPDLTTIPAGDIYTEKTLHYEMYQAKKTIEEKIPGSRIITLAYPFISHNAEVDNIADIYYEGARTGGNTLNNSSLAPLQQFGLYAKKVEFNLPRTTTQDDMDEWQELMEYLQRAINENKWGSIMIHEVYPFSEMPNALALGAFYPLSSEWLTQLCEYLKQKSESNHIWVETVANVLKYSKEKDAFSSSVITQSDTVIEINATDNLDNSIYNYPLTVDIAVPASWDTVTISQNGQQQIVAAKISGEQNIIRAYITPDKGNVILKKKRAVVSSMSYRINGTIRYSGTSASPISDILIKLSGQSSDSALTSANGEVSFNNKSAGNYSVTFSAGKSWSGVTATDALTILMHTAENTAFDSMQLLAADVTNDGKITATDALQVLRRVAGIINKFNKQDWILNPASINITVNDSNMLFDATAIVAGDVNRSYKP